MGPLIALGLIVLTAGALLVQRSPKTLLLAIVLSAAAAAVWLAWADHQYRGFSFCPWGAHVKGYPVGHPVLIGVGLTLGSAAIMTGARWKENSRGRAVVLGLSTGALAGVAILVVAFFFGAGLRCTD